MPDRTYSQPRQGGEPRPQRSQDDAGKDDAGTRPSGRENPQQDRWARNASQAGHDNEAVQISHGAEHGGPDSGSGDYGSQSHDHGGYASPAAGASGYEGGGMSSQTGQTHLGREWAAPAREPDVSPQAGYGGYGDQAGGYGSQSNYGSHGGYGLQGQGEPSGDSPGAHGEYGRRGQWAPASTSGWQHGPTSTGTGSTTHGAGTSVGGTGTSSSTAPGGNAGGDQRESTDTKRR